MKLAVEVVQAQDLKPKDGHGTANPFVEVEFAGQRRRTATKFNNLNPQWNETLFFDVVDPLDLPKSTINVSVFHERLSVGSSASRHISFLGRVRLSGSSAAPSRLDAAPQLCPLEKRSLFSNVRGAIDLRLYVVIPDVGYQAADANIPLSTFAPSTPPVESIPSMATHSVPSTVGTIHDTNTLPPKKNKSQRSSSKVKEKERREFHSIGASPATAKSDTSYTTQFFSNHERRQHRPSQFFYRANHEKAEPATAVPATVQATPPPKSDYKIVETKPPLAALLGYLCTCGSDKIKNTFDLVEQMEFLYVRIVRACELPHMNITGSLDPYAVVKLGDITLNTNHRVQNRNPEWNEVFAFSKAQVQAPRVEIVVKDKNLIKDNVVGKTAVEVADLPKRVPPDGPVAPQWYRLRKGNGSADDESYQGRIMMAVWWGTQADEVYPVALHPDSHHLPPAAVHHTRSKVYFSPRMSYLRVNVVSAQDLQVSRPDPQIRVKIQLGTQQQWTQVSPVRSQSPTWKNEAVMLVAAEPFDERLVLTVVDMVSPTKPEPLAKLVVSKSAIRSLNDHHKPLPPQWFTLEKPDGGILNGGGDDHGKLQVALYYDKNYHVLDEPAHFSSDFQPSAKPLRKPDIGMIELGILDARNLAPQLTNNGGGKSANAYCVAKYGRKWVRSRTILGTTSPSWNEQYSWDVHDLCTVLTVAVFNNAYVDSKNNNNARDEYLGKIRIRLSTLEINRVYTYYYPLMVVHPTGLKKTAELHLAVRLTCKSWINTLLLYTKPTYPKMHYLQPIPIQQNNTLRYFTKLSVVAKLARAEPPLRIEVVHHMLDDGSTRFSLRKGKANFQRVLDLFSEAKAFVKWFDDVQNWRKPALTTFVHALFFVFSWMPSLIVPTTFIYLFLLGAWRYRQRSHLPAHVDMSLADTALPDELDEELDNMPMSTRPHEVIMGRYDRLRIVGGRLQGMVGDLANHAERLQALGSWRDPRATTIFAIFSIIMAGIFYLVPFQFLAAVFGLYVMRHPKFRSKTPSAPINFFKRLPGKADMLL
ncbi:hypothetical protein Cni_G19901 [Canna indica]|uniref:C2 domain-containing protein n=1 Tax=Canna indica TaxID=4628 RepID=A0AAQ3KM81_9LILI|nr:hypothetical protein Cni_G19901 [Canna indica]